MQIFAKQGAQEIAIFLPAEFNATLSSGDALKQTLSFCDTAFEECLLVMTCLVTKKREIVPGKAQSLEKEKCQVIPGSDDGTSTLSDICG